MAVGAIAAGTYGIPRATKGLDLLVATKGGISIRDLMAALAEFMHLDPQVQFDTLTWGRRWIGVAAGAIYKVGLLEMFADPFMISEFDRCVRTFVPILVRREIWIPTAEDVIVQELRWVRPKDLEDARDVMAVQGPETLDMEYVRKWCGTHETLGRLEAALSQIPPL